MTPFQKVFDRLCELVPHLEMSPGKTVAATTLIQQWIDDGCDVNLDILPAINQAFARMTGRPSSASYFDKPVRAAHAERTGSAEHTTRMDESRAKSIRFCQKIGRYVPTYDEAWLAEYESRSNMVLDSHK